MTTTALPHDEPPKLGEIALSFPESPASIQSRSDAKGRVQEMVRAVTRTAGWLLDGPVYVEIDWSIDERQRWESDSAADLDNILKPLLDAFCGPEGILLDDSQIKSLGVAWFSSLADAQRIDVRIRFDANRYLPKRELVFVRLSGPMCYPVPIHVREKGGTNVWLGALRAAIETRESLATLTQSYYPARYVMPEGLVHRSRLSKFPVVDAETLMSRGDE